MQPGVVHAALQREAAAARPALRAGPVDPHPLHDRRDDRQQRLRLAGAGLRPHRRQRRGAPASPSADGTVLDRPGLPAHDAGLAALVDEPPRAPSAPSSAGSAARCRGYSLEHLLPENGRRLDRFLVGTEGTLARGRSRRRCGWSRTRRPGRSRCSATRRWPRPPTPYRRCCAHPLVACEGLDHRIVDVVRGHGGACPSCRAGDGWLFAEVTGATPAEAAALAAGGRRDAGALDTGWSPTPPSRPRCGGSARTAPAWPPARLSRPAQSGWEDAAVPPERLGDYLRDFDALLRDAGLDGVPYGHFGDGCVHVRIDFALDDGGGRGRFREFVEDAADLVASYGGSHVGRARRRPGPLGAAAADVLRRGDRAVAAGQARSSTPTTCSTPACSSTRRRSTPTCGWRPAAPVAPTLRLAHDGGSFGDAVHRCTGVGKCLADNTGAAA